MDDMFESKSRELFIGKNELDIAGKEFEVDDEEDEVEFVEAMDMDQALIPSKKPTLIHREKKRIQRERTF